MDVIIIGAGIGGLTLALMLERAGIPCRVFEAAPAIKPIGVGISLLPHATRELCALGLEPALAEVAITAKESCFFNRFGQLVHREPVGRYAGYEWPQFQIHRGDLQAVLHRTFVARAGADRVVTGWRCTGVGEEGGAALARFETFDTQEPLPPQRGRAVVACDGIHSVVRKQLYPAEGDPIYSGVNMWRGVTRWPPYLTGATYLRAGWLTTGKMVIYPIRDRIDAAGRQLVNWVAEIETPHYKKRDWNRPGNLADFIGAFADWHFDWLDVPALIRASDIVLEFPMVDQDPLPRWSFGGVTLLGDAAHPMYPRGSNGAGQAILDARALADSLAATSDPAAALQAYEAKRLEVTANVVRMNRKNPPDAILREVYLRTGDKPFRNIDEVISREEIMALSDGYKRIAGYDKQSLRSTTS
ncbi:MAG TPA: flavin-dependent oxidoreductase [Alphaproteobacteria bacterium]|nr:flavin-dependent oxidoreductase [Alphaproteobacteria bacterium]